MIVDNRKIRDYLSMFDGDVSAAVNALQQIANDAILLPTLEPISSHITAQNASLRGCARVGAAASVGHRRWRIKGRNNKNGRVAPVSQSDSVAGGTGRRYQAGIHPASCGEPGRGKQAMPPPRAPSPHRGWTDGKWPQRCAPLDVTARNLRGLTTAPSCQTSKCTWAPVERPLEPALAISWPERTRSPTWRSSLELCA